LIAAYIAEVGGARNTHLRANQSTREKSQDAQGDRYSEKPKQNPRGGSLSGTVPSHRGGRRLQWLQAGAEGAEQEEAVIQNASEAVALRAASTSALS
jgi:hypothetical protein